MGIRMPVGGGEEGENPEKRGQPSELLKIPGKGEGMKVKEKKRRSVVFKFG